MKLRLESIKGTLELEYTPEEDSSPSIITNAIICPFCAKEPLLNTADIPTEYVIKQCNLCHLEFGVRKVEGYSVKKL